jgi:O-antigen/teichoic acid export membrane protein
MPATASSLPVSAERKHVSLKVNMVANFAGKLATAALNVVFIRVYYHAMGGESYGLVGVFLLLQGILPIFDLGLSTTLNRELAQLSEREGDAAKIRDTIRTFEVIYWCVTCLIALLVISAAPLIAHHWVHAQHLRSATIQRAICLMGLTLALQFPFDLYAGGLLGVRRQVTLNVAVTASGIATSAGTVLVLLYLSPTIIAFCICQATGALIKTGTCAYLLWRVAPAGAVPSFQTAVLRKVWRFSAGVVAIAMLAVFQTQIDKIVLSGLLTLTMLGYYTMANTVANQLIFLISAIYTALFPAFSALTATGDEDRLTRLYHRGCQLMSVVVLSTGITLAVYSREVMFLWMHNEVIVQHTYLVVSLLTLGTTFNGLMNLPYALQLASGWTRLTISASVCGVVIGVPATIFLAHAFGAPGAAAVWLALNTSYLIFVVNVMHARLLKSEKRKWYTEDVGMPMFGAAATAVLFRLLVPMPQAGLPLALALLIVGACTLTSAALMAPTTRVWLINRLLRRSAAPDGIERTR